MDELMVYDWDAQNFLRDAQNFEAAMNKYYDELARHLRPISEMIRLPPITHETGVLSDYGLYDEELS